MKKKLNPSRYLALIFAGLFFTTVVLAQVPQKFNYQGIARDLKGNPLSKQTLALKLSVLPTEDATSGEYEETQIVSTNEFGLYTLQIGNGSPVIGDMKSVKWETGNKYIRVAIDPKGGSDYTVIGTSQLLSVPYAIYADKAGLARETVNQDGKTRTGTVSSNAAHVAGDVNFMSKFTATNVIGKSLIYDNGARVGIGTTTPLASGLLHLKSVIGTQPLILESPQGVHNLIQENGNNRGYFGSYIGSGGAYPTPAGTTDADFDIGTSGANPTGKLHLATQTTPRMTIDASGLVGVNTTTPTAIFHINKSTDPNLKLTNAASGTTTTDGLDINLSGSNVNINNRENGSITLKTNNIDQLYVGANGKVGVGTNVPQSKFTVLSTSSDTAIIGYTDKTTLSQIGVYGGYNGSGYGAGVVGIGFGGNIPPASTDIGVYGSSSNIAVYSKGSLKVEDGTQGSGKVLTSDANGKASWANHIYSSPWMNSSTNSSDTTVDGTCLRARYLSAPEITQGVLDSALITVYMRVGSIGPYLLPFTTEAGGATNSVACFFKLGKICVYRHTFNTCRFSSADPEAYPGQPVMVNLPSSLEYRYVIQYNY